MKNIAAIILRTMRKLYGKCFKNGENLYRRVDESPYDAQQTSDLIFSMLDSEEPCMIARYGSSEFACVRNYIGVKSGRKSIVKFIKGEQQEWWWAANILSQLQQWSGFFPSNPETAARFSEMMIDDSKLLDLLGCWFQGDSEFSKYVADNNNNNRRPVSTHLMYLEPFWCNRPWTKALKGKRVLVVHPFAELIEAQYRDNRTKLFDNPNVLPEFHLETIKAVQSLGGESNGFHDWFKALEWMESEIDKRDYDICLIGCGAYGFPLAAHCKRMGKKAFHLGGSLQLLFGIKGKRWEDPLYGVKSWGIPEGSYRNLMNEYWISPGLSEKPSNAEKVENGCYW